jgi:3-hydroxybutyryl-CoA dehydrogenase
MEQVVGIIGLGTMGAGIAQVCVEAGHRVLGVDGDPAACERGVERVRSGLERRVRKGQIDEQQSAEALARLEPVEAVEDLSDCDVIVEAIAEVPDVKHGLFAELGRVAKPDAVLATNTSALRVTAIAEASGRPEAVVGLHFFNPAPLMPLVEVVRTDLVDADLFARAVSFVEGLGKSPVPCPDTPGFIVNRILIPMLNDAVRTLDETGVDPADLDRAMVQGAGWPMGPLALIDLIGVDVQVHASEALEDGLGDEHFAPHPRLVEMLQRGDLGKKSGRGFHVYASS